MRQWDKKESSNSDKSNDNGSKKSKPAFYHIKTKDGNGTDTMIIQYYDYPSGKALSNDTDIFNYGDLW